jgi:hypothetical protein
MGAIVRTVEYLGGPGLGEFHKTRFIVQLYLSTQDSGDSLGGKTVKIALSP